MPYADPEAERRYHAAYREAHKERRRLQQLARRRANLAEHREREKLYARAHREQKTANLKRWVKAHPERVRLHTQMRGQRRRARKLGVVSPLTTAQWLAIIAAYKGRCAYCGKKVARLEQEHVIPLVAGGSHSADNVVPACGPCNRLKSVGPPPLLPALRLLL